jgi:hypothetical protein
MTTLHRFILLLAAALLAAVVGGWPAADVAVKSRATADALRTRN